MLEKMQGLRQSVHNFHKMVQSFFVASFLVFLLVLFDVKIEIVALLLIPSFVLFTVLQLLFAPIIKKD